MHSCAKSLAAGIALLLLAPATGSAQSTNAQTLFREARARETALRREMDARRPTTTAAPMLDRARILIAAYDDIARLFPRDTVADDALWQGAALAADTFWEFGEAQERTTALRMFKALTTTFPKSTFAPQTAGVTQRLTAATPSATMAPSPPAPAAAVARTPRAGAVRLTGVRREVLPRALRLVLELDGEATFRDTPGESPSRFAVELENTAAVAALKDTTRTFPDDVVRRLQFVSAGASTTRVAIDVDGAPARSIYALYSPFRVVIDFAREATPAQLAQMTTTRPEPSPPPRPNTSGGFSLSRQLGLGVARVVIDPGHGGHDSGAMNDGLSEAELVLDIALRLEKLLQKQPGVEVVVTRRSNVFVPLEERTAIANREQADLFLSIHANASEDDRLRGVETYFLNFAPNPAAEVVAARENASAARTMGQLPDIVKAIALNNKIDESRDFASFVQSSMLDRLKRANKIVRDLGVKQAPFMVLVGATMPSILAEVSFLTNSQEAGLLRTNSYRQMIAEALFTGVMGYQRSLKNTGRAAGALP